MLSYVLTPKLLVLTGQELRQASRVLSTELCDQIPPTHRKEVSPPPPLLDQTEAQGCSVLVTCTDSDDTRILTQTHPLATVLEEETRHKINIREAELWE